MHDQDLKAQLLPLLECAMEEYPHISRLRSITDSDAETFAKCEPGFGALGNALLKVEELSVFRQGNLQYLGNSAAATTMWDLAYWLIELATLTRNPEAALEDLFTYTEAQKITVHHVQPLAGVFPEGPQEPQNFPNGVILRQAGGIPNIRLARGLTQERGGLPMPKCCYALTKEHRYTAPQLDGETTRNDHVLGSLIDTRQSAQHLEDAALCLSLSTNVEKGVFGICRTFVPDLHSPFAASFVAWELFPSAQPASGFPLGLPEITEGIRLTALLDRLPGADAARIRVPMRHLNLFGAHLSNVERALHMRVALETTFLDKNNRTELNDRLGLRAAIVVGTGLEERKSIKKTIKDAYNAASTAVHQGIMEEKDFKKLSNAAEICQKALWSFLEHDGLPRDEDWFQFETEGFAPRQHRD
ncbi:hypothetical protein ACSSV1_001171 [Labrenzia sp. MBR-25]